MRGMRSMRSMQVFNASSTLKMNRDAKKKIDTESAKYASYEWYAKYAAL